MQPPTSPWLPDEGTPARVKENGLVGIVIQVKGVYERRFRLKVPPPVAAGDAAALKRARVAARRASRWYGLDELEPPS
jgi:hypothetical protein